MPYDIEQYRASAQSPPVLVDPGEMTIQQISTTTDATKQISSKIRDQESLNITPTIVGNHLSMKNAVNGVFENYIEPSDPLDNKLSIPSNMSIQDETSIQRQGWDSLQKPFCGEILKKSNQSHPAILNIPTDHKPQSLQQSICTKKGYIDLEDEKHEHDFENHFTNENSTHKANISTPPAEQKGTPCPDCGKVFRHAAWMRKHRVKHQLIPKLYCTRDDCDKRFKSQTALRRHIRTQHENVYTYRCPICNKGFQDRRKLISHHRSHERHEGFAQQAAGTILGDELIKRLEWACSSAILHAQQFPQLFMAMPRPSFCVVCASMQDLPYFVCCQCYVHVHWQCLGVLRPPEQLFPNPTCPVCLKARGTSSAAFVTSVIGFRMLRQYIHCRALRLYGIKPDSWSLLNALISATPSMSSLLLFKSALSCISTTLPIHYFPAEHHHKLRSMAESALDVAEQVLHHQVNPYYGTPFWNLLIPAIGTVLQRPVHVLNGDVATGHVRLQVEYEPRRNIEQKSDADPIILACCGMEYQNPFYDLVIHDILK
eukprot:gene10003-2178_t